MKISNKPAVKLAIRPINVLSPVRMTIPIHEPSTANVPKKAKFLVSRISSFVYSIPRI